MALKGYIFVFFLILFSGISHAKKEETKLEKTEGVLHCTDRSGNKEVYINFTEIEFYSGGFIKVKPLNPDRFSHFVTNNGCYVYFNVTVGQL